MAWGLELYNLSGPFQPKPLCDSVIYYIHLLSQMNVWHCVLNTLSEQYRHGNTGSQIGWSSEQPNLIEDIPAHCKKLDF